MVDKIIKPVPEAIKRWNWGALVFHIVWGLYHRIWLSFLVFVPFFGQLIMPFVLAAKGNVWAWKKSKIKNVDEFLAQQRKWNIAAGVMGIFFLSMLAVPIWFAVEFNYGAKKEEVLSLLTKQSDVVDFLGMPVEKNSFISFHKKLIDITAPAEIAGSRFLTTLTFEAKGSKTTADIIMSWVEVDNVKKILFLNITPPNSSSMMLIGNKNIEEVVLQD